MPKLSRWTALLFSLIPALAYAAVNPPMGAQMQDPGIWENLARTPFILALCLVVWLFLQHLQKRDTVLERISDSCHSQTAAREEALNRLARECSTALREQAVSNEKLTAAVTTLAHAVETEVEVLRPRGRRQAPGG